MSYPVLLPLDPTAHTPPALAAEHQDLQWFRVHRPGRHQGCWFDRGDLVACAPVQAVSCSQVVLAPIGRGEIRLGRVVGRSLFGAFDEPCSPRRWQAIGAVVLVLRSSGCGSSPDLSSHRPSGPHLLPRAQATPNCAGASVQGGQLPLFASAA